MLVEEETKSISINYDQCFMMILFSFFLNSRLEDAGELEEESDFGATSFIFTHLRCSVGKTVDR